MSYSANVYKPDADTLVIGAGGKLKVEAGGAVEGLAAVATEYTDVRARNAVKTKTQVAALVSPSADYANLAEVTAAIKAIIDALKA